MPSSMIRLLSGLSQQPPTSWPRRSEASSVLCGREGWDERANLLPRRELKELQIHLVSSPKIAFYEVPLWHYVHISRIPRRELLSYVYFKFTFCDCSFPRPFRTAPTVANSDTHFGTAGIKGGRRVEISEGKDLEGRWERRKVIRPSVKLLHAHREGWSGESVHHTCSCS